MVRTGAWLAVALLGSGTAAYAADGSCRPVYDAMKKLRATPFHEYIDRTAATDASDAPTRMELISTGGRTYVNVRGKWRGGDADLGEVDDEGLANCSRLADDPAAPGAAVYQATSHTEDDNVTGKVWIDQATGLPLRLEYAIDVGGSAGKSHASVRFDYQDVTPPPGVE